RALRAKEVHFAHARNDRAAGTAGIPCANGLRLIRDLPGVPGLLASVASRPSSARLDASIGAPGPRDFAVRACAARLAARTRPSQPASRFVTIGRNVPRGEAGWVGMYF